MTAAGKARSPRNGTQPTSRDRTPITIAMMPRVSDAAFLVVTMTV